MKQFLKRYYPEISFLIFIILLVFLSWQSLVTKPRLWYDEGITIEVAHNLSFFRNMDMQISPGEFSGAPYRFEATGYPVIASLALVYKVFGFGPIQTRLTMLLWMILVLGAIFFLIKKLFNSRYALYASLLVGTFASFYAHGRTAIGEIPGFLFLILGLYKLLGTRSLFWSGIFLGLALATKPSIYLAVIPALIFYIWKYFEREEILKKISLLSAGIAIPLAVDVLMLVPHPFSFRTWAIIFQFFKNPFGMGDSMSSVIFTNIVQSPFIPALDYFFFFSVACIIAYYSRDILTDLKVRKFYFFSLWYCFFAFLYYLKSPGWLRYVIAAEMLILMMVPVAIETLIQKFFRIKKESVVFIFIALLMCFQVYHFFTSADIFYSVDEIGVLNTLSAFDQGQRIGVLNIPHIGAFVNPDDKYQLWKMLGVPVLGQSLVRYDPPLDVIVTKTSNYFEELSVSDQTLFLSRYKPGEVIGMYTIYHLSSQ